MHHKLLPATLYVPIEDALQAMSHVFAAVPMLRFKLWRAGHPKANERKRQRTYAG